MRIRLWWTGNGSRWEHEMNCSFSDIDFVGSFERGRCVWAAARCERIRLLLYKADFCSHRHVVEGNRRTSKVLFFVFVFCFWNCCQWIEKFLTCTFFEGSLECCIRRFDLQTMRRRFRFWSQQMQWQVSSWIAPPIFFFSYQMGNRKNLCFVFVFFLSLLCHEGMLGCRVVYLPWQVRFWLEFGDMERQAETGQVFTRLKVFATSLFFCCCS